MANAEGKNLPERLQKLGVSLEKVPFWRAYWVGNPKSPQAQPLIPSWLIRFRGTAQIPATLFTNIKNKTVLDAVRRQGANGANG